MPVAYVHVGAPSAESTSLEGGRSASVGDAIRVRGDRVAVDRACRRGEVGDARDHKAGITDAHDLVDAHPALVEDHRQPPVELFRVGEVPIHLGRRRPRHHDVAHGKRLHPESRDIWVGSGVHLVRHVSPPRIGEREVDAAAHLWHIREDPGPESVVSREIGALAGPEMRLQPDGDGALAPISPRGVGSEALANAQPSARADRDHERGNRDTHGRSQLRRAEEGRPANEPRDRNAERDGCGCIELERVANGLRCERDAGELTRDDDRPEDTGPADGQSESFRQTAVEPRDPGKGRDEHHRQP